MVLGCFANFAQNEYGMTIVIFSSLLFAIGWLINLILLGREVWKKKIFSIILFSTISLFFLSMLFFIFNANDFFGFGMLIFTALLIMESLIAAIANRKQHKSSGTILAFESFGLFFLFLGVFFKFSHWPGANIMLILGGFILTIVYLIEIFKMFRSEFKNGKMIALFSAIFYLNIIIGAVASVFKNQHWPFSRIFSISEVILLIILLIPMMLNLKFKHGTEKINLFSLSKKSAVLVFVFIYMNYWALFFAFQVWGIGPKFYTLAKPPVLEKMLDKSANGNEPQIVAYSENYNNFLERRRNFENK